MTINANKTAALTAVKSAGAPDDAQLAAINGYALAAQTADQVYVRTAYLAHNAIDRDGEAFTESLLNDFAASLPGKGLFVKHPGGWDGDSGPGVGRWFAAAVVAMDLQGARAALRQPDLQFPPGVAQAKLLEASFYLPRTGKNADLIADIDAGVAGDVSIGFRAAKRAPIEGPGGEYMGALLFGPGEALEGSLVWLGAQPGARVAKAAKTGNNEESDVDTKQLQDENTKLKNDLKAAEQLAGENTKKAMSFDGVKAAVGDLAEKPEALKLAVEEAKAFRAGLVDEMVRMDRLAGVVGDSEDDAKTAKAMYAGVDIKTLQGRVELARKKFGAGSQLAGDPNVTGAAAPQEGEAKGVSEGRAALV